MRLWSITQLCVFDQLQLTSKCKSKRKRFWLKYISKKWRNFGRAFPHWKKNICSISCDSYILHSDNMRYMIHYQNCNNYPSIHKVHEPFVWGWLCWVVIHPGKCKPHFICVHSFSLPNKELNSQCIAGHVLKVKGKSIQTFYTCFFINETPMKLQ